MYYLAGHQIKEMNNSNTTATWFHVGGAVGLQEHLLQCENETSHFHQDILDYSTNEEHLDSTGSTLYFDGVITAAAAAVI